MLKIPERRRVLVAMALTGAAVGVGLVVPAIGLSERQALILANAIAVIAPLIWLAGRGNLDILSPLPWALAALGLIFVVRPVVDMGSGYAFRGMYDLTAQFNTALLAGLIATVACLGGYGLPTATRWAQRLPALREHVDPAAATALAFTLFAIGAAAYAIYATRAGGSFVGLVGEGFSASMSVSTAYLYLAPFMAFPALLVLLQRTLIGGSVWPLPIIAIFVSMFALVLAPAGQRLWLMLLLAPFLIYPMLRSGYRPRLVSVFAVALVAVATAVSMRDLQPGQGLDGWFDSLRRVVEDPAGTVYEFAAGPDTEMFDGLALGMQEVPEHLDFQPLSSVTSLIFHPIPREMWPEKPATMDGIVDVALFTDLQSGAASVAHSVVGNFYYDSGFLGVALGMVAVGFGLRLIYAYYRAHATNDHVRLIYASTLPLVIVLFRGNLPDTLARALFTVGPFFLLALLGAGGAVRRQVARVDAVERA